MKGAELIMSSRNDKVDNRFGYGFKITCMFTAETKYGYVHRSTCYSKLRKHVLFKDALKWEVFKIDALGYHTIQKWERV